MYFIRKIEFAGIIPEMNNRNSLPPGEGDYGLALFMNKATQKRVSGL